MGLTKNKADELRFVVSVFVAQLAVVELVERQTALHVLAGLAVHHDEGRHNSFCNSS